MTLFNPDRLPQVESAPAVKGSGRADDSTRPKEAGSDGAVDDAALRSFIFEVSAGRPQGVADATKLRIRVDGASVHPAGSDTRKASRKRLRRTKPGSINTNVSHSHAEAGAVDETPVAEAPKTHAGDSRELIHAAPTTRSADRSPKPRHRSPRRRHVPATFVSVGLHSMILVALLATELPGIEPLQELLLSFAATPEELEFTEVNFEPTPEDPPIDGEAEVPSDLLDPGAASFGDLESSAALADVGANAVLPTGALDGELGALFGDQGVGSTAFDSGVGDAPLAKFFGQEIEGRRIVFVLDNSGSMQGGRLETVISELLRCVESLREDQEFYVMFHSDTVYPLFYPDGVDRYIRPTPANKRMLTRWLETVELCLGDAVDDALAIAAMIEPDTVFLLSDGRIQGDKKIRFLLDGQSRNFPIHTFAVGMGGSVAGRRNLADVAAANRGEFRESEIPDEMKQLARDKLRPYHSERPGRVWGRQVKPFRPRG